MAMRKTKTRARDGRLRLWPSGWLRYRKTSPPTSTPEQPVAATSEGTLPLRAVVPGQHEVTRDDLKKQITTAAIAFRGYDASNLGRGPELLEHRVYGSVVR